MITAELEKFNRLILYGNLPRPQPIRAVHSCCRSSASRNLAIVEASGELLALLDADDVWLPGYLRFQIENLDAHPEAALTFGAAERWFSWDAAGREADFIVPAEVPCYGSDVLIPPPHVLRAFLLDESLTPCTCATLLRRSSIDDAQPFDVSFPGSMTIRFFWRRSPFAIQCL